MFHQLHGVEEPLPQMELTVTQTVSPTEDMLVNGLHPSLKLPQLRTTAPTQAKPPVLTRTAPLQETLPGTPSLPQELLNQRMPKLPHIQDTPSTEIEM